MSYIADEDTIAAAWLHDVIEDCDVKYIDIADSPIFNKDVADLVLALTNPSKFHFDADGKKPPREARKRLDREHIHKANYKVQYIKLCDRLDNLKDLKLCPDQKFLNLYLHETELLVEPIDVCKNIKQQIYDEIFSLRRQK